VSESTAAVPSLQYLVYGENGATLLYAGDDAEACSAVCSRLAREAAGHVKGYQFVGKQRYEVLAYFDAVPAESFLAARRKRDLFDFGWVSGS